MAADSFTQRQTCETGGGYVDDLIVDIAAARLGPEHDDLPTHSPGFGEGGPPGRVGR